MKIGFIGCGHMGEHILRGIWRGEHVAERILVSVRSEERAQTLRDKYSADGAGTSSVPVEICTDNAAVASEADILFIAVKPAQLADVAETIRDVMAPGTVLVSVLAGKTMKDLTDAFGTERPIIRLMPNLMAGIGQMVGAYCVSGAVTDMHRQTLAPVWTALGHVYEIEEEKIDAFMAVACCAPAYAALFADALVRGGVKQGLTREEALPYVLQMMEGTAAMLLEEGTDPATFVKQVCTPGGTTIEGYHVLGEGGFVGLVEKAIVAATKKAKRL